MTPAFHPGRGARVTRAEARGQLKFDSAALAGQEAFEFTA